MEDFIKNELHMWSLSSRYAQRYIKFIEWCESINGVVDHEYVENHHILPQREFPEYKNLSKCPANKITLSGRQHFIAHYMLSKMFLSQVFAFNMMRRLAPNNILYNYARQHISSALSTLHMGRCHMKESTRRKKSEAWKGSVFVRGTDGKCFRVSKIDPRYVSGELLHPSVGATHSQATKDRIRDNGTGGKLGYTKDGVTRYFSAEESVPEGYIWGNTQEYKQSMSASCKNATMWITENSSGASSKISVRDFDPSIHVRGRKDNRGDNNKGFAIVNSSNTKTVFDLVMKKFIVVDKDAIGPYINNGGGSTKFMILQNKYVLASSEIIQLYTFRIRGIISKPHNSHTKFNKAFTKLNKGKTLNEIGINIVTIDEFIAGNIMFDPANMEICTINELPESIRRETFGIAP